VLVNNITPVKVINGPCVMCKRSAHKSMRESFG
jgi:hypothetical protein